MIASLVLSALALAADTPPSDSTGLAAPPPAAVVLAPPIGGFRPATPRDTVLRAPGSPLRFGWTQERLAALGPFRRVSGSATQAIREGDCVWFGAPAQAQLTFRGDHLSRVRLTLQSVAPHVLDYVLDEMRREGFRRTGWSSTSDGGEWEWVGPTLATLTFSGTTLTGDFRLNPEPPPPLAAPAPATSALDTLDLAQPGDRPPPVRRFTPDLPPRPPAAVASGLFGRVVMRALVDTSGVVIDAGALRGPAALESAALDWARAIRFEPYLDRGRAVRFWTEITALFVPGGAARP